MADISRACLLLLVIVVTWYTQSTQADDNAFTTHVPTDADDEDMISVTSILVSPFLVEREPTEGEAPYTGNARYEGLVPSLLDALAQGGFMPANYKLFLVKDEVFGTRDSSSGLWNGMIGEVQRREVDMAAAPLSITDMRKTAVNFSDPWANVSLTVAANKEDEVKNLNQLVNRSHTDLAFGTVGGGSTYEALSHEQSPPFPSLWAAMNGNASNIMNSVAEGLERASKGGYAFILEDYNAPYYMKTYCSLETVGKFLPRQGYGFAFAKDSTLIADINRGIRALNADGTLERLRAEWMETAHCSGADAIQSPLRWSVLLAVMLTGLLIHV